MSRRRRRRSIIFCFFKSLEIITQRDCMSVPSAQMSVAKRGIGEGGRVQRAHQRNGDGVLGGVSRYEFEKRPRTRRGEERGRENLKGCINYECAHFPIKRYLHSVPLCVCALPGCYAALLPAIIIGHRRLSQLCLQCCCCIDSVCVRARVCNRKCASEN